MITITQYPPFLSGETGANKNVIDDLCFLQRGAESVERAIIGIGMRHLFIGIFQPARCAEALVPFAFVAEMLPVRTTLLAAFLCNMQITY